MITSLQNPKVKWVRALQAKANLRHEENVILVEGVRLLEEAVQAGWRMRLVLHSSVLSARSKEVLTRLRPLCETIEEVSPTVMQAVSDTETPQGLLAVVSLPPVVVDSKLDFVLVVDEVRDPGNLGTILRTAAAAGVQAVFVPPGTVDPYAPKVVRAGMGAHFRLPLWQASWPEMQSRLQGLHVFLADTQGEIRYDEADFCSPLALIIGGEATGASAQARQLATRRVRIPMPGEMESLNAAVAAGILLFEVVRQRRLRK